MLGCFGIWLHQRQLQLPSFYVVNAGPTLNRLEENVGLSVFDLTICSHLANVGPTLV